MAAADAEDGELLDALADGGLLNELESEQPETPEEHYMHHIGMRRATIFSGCLCGVIMALIISIAFVAVWLTGEVPFIDPPVYCTNSTINDDKWHTTSSIHMIQAPNGISYVMYMKYNALWHHVCENSLGKVVSRAVFRIHRLVLYSSDSSPPFSNETVLLEANTTDRMLQLMDAELDQYIGDMPTLLSGPWSVFYDNVIYFFMDSPVASAAPGLGALYIANLTTGRVQTLGSSGWNPFWVAKFGDVWINSTKEYMAWCHPFMFQTFPNNPVPYILWGFNGGSGCEGTFERWSSNAGLAPLAMGTNDTWNFGLTQRIMIPVAHNTSLLMTNFASLPSGGLPGNSTLVRVLLEPTSSLPWRTPWDGNWTALYVRRDLSALVTSPSYWRSKFGSSIRCLWYDAARKILTQPDGNDTWNLILCGGYGGNIGRRGVQFVSKFIVFDPDTETFTPLTRIDGTNGLPTAAHLGSMEQAELWPLHVRVKNEIGSDQDEEQPCIRMLGEERCWEP